MGKYIEDKKKIDDLINISKNILITCHQNPDGDAFGSVVSMDYYLSKYFPKINKEIVITGKRNASWDWWKDLDKINYVEDIVTIIDNYDLLIFLDGSNYSQFSNKPDILEKKISDKHTICIDHHINTQGKFDLLIQYPMPKAAANCQLLAEMLFNDEDITDESASNLLRGIYFDLGGLKFLSHGGTDVLLTIKRLMDLSTIPQMDLLIFGENSIPTRSFNVFKTYINNLKNMEIKGIPPFTFSYVSFADQETSDPDEVGLLRNKVIQEYICTFPGYKWGFLITEHKDTFRVSFKSLPGSVNCSKLAATYFNGGGHVRRSGSINPKEGMNIDQIVEKTLNIIKTAEIELI